MNLNPNEIRDYIERAPKKWAYDGLGMTNNTGARYAWLGQLCRGTINERINRHAGIIEKWIPWKNPIWSAIRRNKRNHLRVSYPRQKPGPMISM